MCHRTSWEEASQLHLYNFYYYLALAEGALCAMLNPRRSSEANDIGFIQTCFSDVVANSVGLAGVSDTAWAALVLGEDTEFTVHLWAGQGPAVNFSLLFSERTRYYY